MNGSEEVKFTREDLVCLTETCTTLKEMRGEIRDRFDALEKKTVEKGESLEEITKGQFSAVTSRLDDLSKATKSQRDACDTRFKSVETDVSDLKTFRTRIMAFFGAFGTLVAFGIAVKQFFFGGW